MSLVATARAAVGSSGQVASKGSGAFTPAANSKLYVKAWGQNTALAAFTFTIADTSGLSWTLKDSVTGGSFAGKAYLWEASVGAAPVSTTVTITAVTNNAEIVILAFDVTGNTPQIKSGQLVHSIATDGQATVNSGVLPAAVLSGNLAVLAEAANRDSFTVLVTPASWTSLEKTPSGGGNYEQGMIATNPTFTGTSVSHSNGIDNESYATFLFEIEEAGSPPAVVPLALESGGFLLSESGVPIA